MKKCIITLLALIVCWATNAQKLLRLPDASLSIEEKTSVAKHLRNYEVVSINEDLLVSLSRGDETNFTIDIEGVPRSISVRENNLISPNYASGENAVIGSSRPTIKTFKGFVGGNPENIVRFAIDNNFFDGFIRDESGLIFIKPLDQVLSNSLKKNTYLVFKGTDVIYDPNILDCGVLEGTKDVIDANDASNGRTASATTSCHIVEIATEADFELYQARGSSLTATNNSIISALNQIEGIYTLTFNMKFIITFQNVWTTSSDPYSQVALLGDPTGVLNEFKNYWQSNFTSVVRDAAYFFSGKTNHTVRGAVLSVGVMCSSPSNSYGFTAVELANVNIVTTTAHEIGHFFNATHPHASLCTTATIMCTLGGSGTDTRLQQFHQLSVNEITDWTSNHSACITELASVNVIGTTPVCSTGSYSVQGLPAGATVSSWGSSTSGLSISGGSATRQSNYIGQAVVTAYGTVEGCSYTSTKTVWVGPPNTPGSISGDNPVYPSQNVSYYTSVTPGASSYTWAAPSGWSGAGTVTTTYKSFTAGSLSGNVTVKANNTCGSSSLRSMYVSTSGCGTCRSISLIPNPADNIVDIVSTDPSSVDIENISGYIIYDIQGRLITRYESDQKLYQINTSALQDGIYIVHLVGATRRHSIRLAVTKK